MVVVGGFVVVVVVGGFVVVVVVGGFTVVLVVGGLVVLVVVTGSAGAGDVVVVATVVGTEGSGGSVSVAGAGFGAGDGAGRRGGSGRTGAGSCWSSFTNGIAGSLFTTGGDSASGTAPGAGASPGPEARLMRRNSAIPDTFSTSRRRNEMRSWVGSTSGMLSCWS